MKKVLIMLVSLIALVGCDRITKVLAIDNLKGNAPLSYFSGLFQLIYHENSGAMLSLGSNLSEELRFYIFIVAVGLALFAGIVYVIFKPLDKIDLTLALLMIGGGLGNLYDRVFNDGFVVDFMILRVGAIQTGVFNVADMAIMAGALGMLFFSTQWGSHLKTK